MRRVFTLGILATVCWAASGSADLVTPRKIEPRETIAPYSVRTYVDAYKANELARVIMSGRGHTCMGIYVFDGQGNCVAKDDLSPPIASDDLNVIWTPTVAGRYCVEIRNLGPDGNEYQMNIR